MKMMLLAHYTTQNSYCHFFGECYSFYHLLYEMDGHQTDDTNLWYLKLYHHANRWPG